MTFYSFRLMVALGMLFLLIFVVSLWLVLKKPIEKYRWFLRLTILAIPLVYLAGQAGWIVAEMGRQPWVVQDLLPRIRSGFPHRSGSGANDIYLVCYNLYHLVDCRA